MTTAIVLRLYQRQILPKIVDGLADMSWLGVQVESEGLIL
jgi:hypothetical protein